MLAPQAEDIWGDLKRRTIFPGWDDRVYFNAYWSIFPIALGLQDRAKHIKVAKGICLIRQEVVQLGTDERWSMQMHAKPQPIPIAGVPDTLGQHLYFGSVEPYENPHPTLMDAPLIALEPDWLGLGFTECIHSATGRILRRTAPNKTLLALYDAL